MKLVNRMQVAPHPGVKWTACEPHIDKFELRGEHYWYDPNSMQLWKVESLIAEALDVGSIASREKPYITLGVQEMPHKMLVFQTTYACNLDCSYCFVTHHYLNHTNRMDLDTAIKAVNMYQSPRFGRPYNIGFFGGEPLMNWKLIYQLTQEIIKRANENKLGYSFHVTTNATLVTEEIAEYLAEHNFSLIVSIDGDEEFHDQNRPYHKGGGTHKDVMRGLEYITEAYAKKGKPNPITLRSTFDRSGVDLPKQLEYLNKLMYDGFGKHVSIEPSSLGESCSTAPARFETNTYDEIRAMFEDEYWRAADWFLDELKAGRKPSFHHFEMVLQRLYDREPAFTECGAGNGYLSIGPGGKISACHRENGSEIGNLRFGIDPTKQAKWLYSNLSFTHKTCPSCFRRNMCGGGCRQEAIQGGNDIFTPDAVECLFKYMYTKPVFWMMDKMTQEQKELYSKYPSGVFNQQNQMSMYGAPQSTAAVSQTMNQVAVQQAQNNGNGNGKIVVRECNKPDCGCHEQARQQREQQQNQQQQEKLEPAAV